MDTKIKALILLLFSAFTTFAQTPGINFAAKFNITSATGGDPYNITGIVLDDLSRFTGSDVQVNDSIYVIDGDQLYVLAVTSITSVVGPTVTLVANDPNNAGVSIPTGQAAICRPTDNYKLPLYISGLRDDLRSMVMNRQAQLIDDINGSAVSAITDFTSAGVNVPPSPAASLNGGETWRNMTTGELWGSDGNVWYPYTRGPKECQDTVLVSAITVQSGGSVTTGSPLIRNSSGVWEHMYNHPSGLNLIPDGVVTDIVTGGKAIVQYCGVRKGSGATPNTSYYVDQSISTGFTTTKPTTNIRPLGKVASNGDFLINAGLLFSRDNNNGNNGISSDGTNLQLGNTVGGTTSNFTTDRDLPLNGNRLNITGNTREVKITTGTNNYIQFSDTLTVGRIKIKNPSTTSAMTKFLFEFSPPTNSGVTQQSPYYFGISNSPQSGNSGNNVFMHGWNLAPGGSKVEPGKPAIGESTEQNFRPSAPSVYPRYVEKHEFYIPSYSNIQRRLSSYTITEALSGFSNIDFYHTVDRFAIRDTSGHDYYAISGNNSSASAKFSRMDFTAGNKQLYISVDSTQNLFTIQNNSSSGTKATSNLQINAFRQLQITDNYAHNIMSYVGYVGQQDLSFGTPSFPSSTTFYNNAAGINSAISFRVNSSANTATNLSSRANLFVVSGTNEVGFGVRSDINMGYIGNTGSFAIRTNALQVGPAAGTTLPIGVALQVNSNLANTSALFRLQSTTDSVKYFVTSVNPNTVITGRVGDIANGSNGTTYIKKSGNNTNTGWEALVSTPGTSASISTMMREESFTATAAQTAFTIAYSAPAVSGTSVPIRVYRNGVRLFYVASGPTITQFTYSGTTVTTAANTAGDIITIEYLN